MHPTDGIRGGASMHIRAAEEKEQTRLREQFKFFKWLRMVEPDEQNSRAELG